MRTKLIVTFAALALSALAPAQARDDRNKFPIKAALGKGQAYKEKLESDIALYFGNQKAPAIAKRLGEWTSNKKTNAFNKSDQEACEVAFISAAAALQDRARREGGNAVVNIRSVYKNDNVVSETEYVCGSGAVMAGVALRGTVVSLAKGKK
jgi:uncharacterized protein YbjQ (UPF0145 family)